MSNNRSILFIMPALLGGGAEKVLIDILQNFDFTKYDVSLLLEFNEGVYLNRIPNNVRVISLYKKDTPWFHRAKHYSHLLHCFQLSHSILFKSRLRRRLKGENFDTIVSFMEGEAVKLHSYILDKGLRNVSWVHINLETKHWSLNFFSTKSEEARIYSKMDSIITVSSDARDAFCRLFPDSAANTELIYNLIDRAQIREKAEGADRVNKGTVPVICAVGRLNTQKRYDRALNAVRILKDRGLDFELWILGQGELEQELRMLTCSLGVDDKVRFIGFIANPYPIISACDVFLNSSDSEGYPLTVCEAVCLGKAIVATDVTGSHEIVTATDSGILVERSPEAIADALELLLTNTSLRASYEANALSGAKMFDVGKTMSQIYDVL